MQRRITHLAMDDRKRTIVAGILRPKGAEPELRSIPNEPRHLRRCFARLQRGGRVVACYEAGEAVRDLLRCREDVHEDLGRWRHRLRAVHRLEDTR